MARARSAADGLIRRVAQGDTDAFGELYTDTALLVYGTAVRVLGDRGYSEEVTQEVYLGAWRQAADFDATQGSAEAWLVTMAHRRSVDRVRSERARGVREDRYVSESYQPPRDVVADTAESNARSVAVVDCLATLTEPQRDALTMAYYGGRTYREVADHLDTPLPTIKSRIRDGIARLRKCLGPQHE